jgi:hypothetical protein
MDWIERWFNLAPDNGDGTLELLIILTVVALVLLPAVLSYPRIRSAVGRFIYPNRERNFRSNSWR